MNCSEGPIERRFVADLSRRCQILTPIPQHWLDVADILNRMRSREHYEGTKLRNLSFDVLIALSARSIGATVITCNASDFHVIRRSISSHLLDRHKDR